MKYLFPLIPLVRFVLLLLVCFPSASGLVFMQLVWIEHLLHGRPYAGDVPLTRDRAWKDRRWEDQLQEDQTREHRLHFQPAQPGQLRTRRRSLLPGLTFCCGGGARAPISISGCSVDAGNTVCRGPGSGPERPAPSPATPLAGRTLTAVHPSAEAGCLCKAA